MTKKEVKSRKPCLELKQFRFGSTSNLLRSIEKYIDNGHILSFYLRNINNQTCNLPDENGTQIL
jgi:hypothetical protein